MSAVCALIPGDAVLGDDFLEQKCAISAISAISLLLVCRRPDLFADRDTSAPEFRQAVVASLTGVSGAVFSKLSKLLNQEDALGAPCLLSAGALAGRGNTADMRDPSPEASQPVCGLSVGLWAAAEAVINKLAAAINIIFMRIPLSSCGEMRSG